MMNVSRVLNTVKYMTFRQWKYRIFYSVRNKVVRRKPEIPKKIGAPCRIRSCFSVDVGNKDSVKEAEMILKGEIPTISCRYVNISDGWDLRNEQYRLVCFRLNSFRWLLVLSDAFYSTREKKYIEKGFEYIRRWNDECGKSIKGDKWNPYVIAERISNWIGFVSQFGDEEQMNEVARYIYAQAVELRKSIEYQLGANHLLSEAKALILSGAFLKIRKIYETGTKILADEIHEQFYSDGGHYEQSVSYHVEALQQYFEALAVFRVCGDKETETLCASWMEKPYCFLNGMIGVDGKIPLFNDAAYDYPFYDASDFLSTASYIFETEPPKGRKSYYAKRWEWLGNGSRPIDWKSCVLYADTGFVHYPFEFGGIKYSFFMDCGNNGPDYNLGHAHADALNVLLISENKAILVDSGVFTYQPGEERNECRSTKAHNTVEVDSMNSAEIWSAFRVAKRGHTKIKRFSMDDGLKVLAAHDGYAKCLKDPVVHSRKVYIRNGAIEIDDVVKGKKNHNAISRFHVSPESNVILIDRKTCTIDGIQIKSDQEIHITDCKVADLFGMVKPSKCIEIVFKNNVKTMIKLMEE